MKRQLMIIALILAILHTNAQRFLPLDTLLGKKALTDDLHELKALIIDSHPNPFAFQSEENFHEAFLKAEKGIDSTTTLRAFYKLTCKALRSLKDSHTGPDYIYLQKWWLENDKGIAPIKVISLEGALYVVSDADSLLPPGAKIECIENREAFKFYPDALEYSLIEGDAITGQRRITDAMFMSLIGLDHPTDDSLKIDFIPYGMEESKEIVYPVYKKEKWNNRQKMLQKDGSRNLSLRFSAHDSLAILKVGTFAPMSIRAQEKYLKSAFKEIQEKNVKYLAVDLRDNGGGHSHQVEVLMSYLLKDGHNTPHNIIAKGSKLSRDRGGIAQKGFSRFLLKLLFGRNEDVKGFIRMIDLPDGQLDTIYFSEKEKQKQELVYKNNCVLFINGLTASAGVDFSNTFREEKRGLIIGEPCLGPPAGTFGNPAVFDMKNSGLRFTISTIRYNYNDLFIYEEAPIKPDRMADLTPEILAMKKDPCIMVWKKYIQENEKK